MISKKFALITVFFAVSSLAMDQKPKLNIKITMKKAADTTQPITATPIVKQSASLATIRNSRNDLIVTDLNPVIYYTGINPTVASSGFYGEYRARILDNSRVTFPIVSCDPLPLNTFGSIRYFFTSAISGNCPHMGQPIKIDNTAISNIVVVRGKSDSGNRFEAYLGYNHDDFENSGRRQIYQARLLALTVKLVSHVENVRFFMFEPASCLSVSSSINCEGMDREISKHLENSKDHNWESPVFHDICRKLLGEGWVSYDDHERNRNEKCFYRDGAIFGNGKFYSPKVYWTKSENTLKGITY